jgi:sulfite reductase alpha subunit-like flavoprotein
MSPPVAQSLLGLNSKDLMVSSTLNCTPNQVAIFYGSQSGTAECFAEDLQEEASKQGITSEVHDLRSFTPEMFAMKKVVILVVATYGDGEPTDNAVDFYRWASNPDSCGALAGQRFCVMGLGDMNYTKFCQMGKDTDLILERMGAKRIYELGIGDDSQDIAEDFRKWKEGGLWQNLQKAAQDCEAEGGYVEMAKAAKKIACENNQLPLFLFIGHEEKDGGAQDVADTLVEKFKDNRLGVPTIQKLSDRKACEVVKKMPRGGVALVVVDSAPEGLCSAGKKLVRNMTVELDKCCLKEKGIRFGVLTVATSNCGSSAAAMKNQIQQNSAPLSKAFDRAGAFAIGSKFPSYVDLGTEEPEPVFDQVCKVVSGLSCEPLPDPDDDGNCKVKSIFNKTLGINLGDFQRQQSPATPAVGPRTILLCTGNEAREAGQALTKIFGNRCSVEDAALVSMAGAARHQTQVVLVVDCSADGLSDGARGLSSQLMSAPAAMQAQLRKLKFALVTVVCTDVGNAGERANANAARSEIARAVDPIVRCMAKIGASCVASSSLDLQDANENTIAEVSEAIKTGFGMVDEKKPARGNDPTAAPTPMRLSPRMAAVPAEAAVPAAGMTEVRLSSSLTGLPAEAEGEPACCVSRFYFEAEECKILKVKQLRQQPQLEEGLSTVEIEIEASGKLKDYSLGGTLSMLPENSTDDVHAVLPFFGLQPDDLKKSLTFVAGAGVKLKRPFPTPCTLGKALTRYCDLSKPPTKKMLEKMQPRLQDQDAKERVAQLLKDEETLKLLQASSLCCRMHEFWALLGVTSLDLSEFLLNCPRQKAREFTIASSPKASPGKISLCVSQTSHEQSDLGSILQVLKEKGYTSENTEAPCRGKRFCGVCSTWMNSRMKVGDMVLCKQRSSALKLPEKDVPVIMVGAGAGLAPFRGFWEELRKGPQKAPAMLFFGCRHPDKDWLYKEEMNGAVKLGAACGALARMQVGPKRPLAGLYTAFSRPDAESEKKYVQDQISKQASMVKQAMENEGSVFICGSTAMGNAVLKALGEIIEGGAADVEALRKQGRIVAEMWG